MMQHPLTTVLTIAGSDSSAGAGIQADLKTIHALGGYALTAITAITAQNSQGVEHVYPVSAAQLETQLKALFVDYKIHAIKIGMLANDALINVVVKTLKQNPSIPVVLDPIILSSSGKLLLKEAAINHLITKLLPLATLITPNLPELNRLFNQMPNASINSHFTGSAEEAPSILEQLAQNHWPNTLVKGGHSTENLAIDYLFTSPTYSALAEIFAYPGSRIDTQNTHGTGCTLSSAIATQLAFNRPLTEAVKLAKNYLHNALSTADYGQPHYQQAHNLHNSRHGGLNHFGQKAMIFADEEE